MMKSLITTILRAQALHAVRKHKPIIIAVTGSYGKTSAKDAIAMLLSYLLPQKSVRYPKKSFNNEFGVPLSILGEESPNRSVFGWIKLLVRGWFAQIPSVLILEVGADHKGEIQSWAKALKPHIAVITGVSPVHVANYASYDELKAEKASLAVHATQKIILNADDKDVMSFGPFTAPVTTYGMNTGAQYRVMAGDLLLRADHSYEPGELLTQLQGIIEVSANDGTVIREELALQGATGKTALASCVIAFAVMSEVQKLSAYPFAHYTSQEMAAALSKFWKPTIGRMNPLPGIKGTVLLDDTYNAAPAAVEHGLYVLSMFPNQGRKIAALGKMAELGDMSESLHRQMGNWVAASADFFVAVGEEALLAVDEAKKYGMTPDRMRWFATAKEAGAFLDGFVEQGDAIYIKGSQSARMEFVTKELLAQPERAAELLVRQEQQWLA